MFQVASLQPCDFSVAPVAVEYAQPSTSDSASAVFREPGSKQSTNDLSECTLGVSWSHYAKCKKKHIFQLCNDVYLANNSDIVPTDYWAYRQINTKNLHRKMIWMLLLGWFALNPLWFINQPFCGKNPHMKNQDPGATLKSTTHPTIKAIAFWFREMYQPISSTPFFQEKSG